jgi:hypothetical protein
MPGNWHKRGPGLLVLAPLTALALYVAIFVVRSTAIVTTLYLNADIASGPVIAQSLATTPGHTEVLLGNYPWFEALGLMSILRELPAHRWLWEATPFALAVVTVGLVAWGTWHAAGRRAAMLTLVIGLAAAPATVADLGSWTVHGLTWVHTALLGGLAVWLQGARERRVALGAAALVGFVCGPALASDLLLIPGGLLPLWTSVLVLGIVARRANTRPDNRIQLQATILSTTFTTVGAGVTLLVANHENVHGAGTLPIRFTKVNRLGHNLHVLWESLAALGNGDVFNVAFGGSTLVHTGCAGLAIIAVGTALWVAWSAIATRSSPAMIAHAAFWGSAMVALILAFLLSSVPVAAFSGRYLVGVLLAVAALVPLAALRGPLRGMMTSAAITYFALAGVMSLIRGEMTANTSRFPPPVVADQLARYVTQQGAAVGYAGYWDAAQLTWASHFATHIYPVGPCENRLCAFQFHRIASWYNPRATSRSYLVLDPAARQITLRSLPATVGTPVASAHVGQLYVYVFDYDVARTFGAPLKGPQT